MKPIGIIGGSGLDNPDILERPEDRMMETAFGQPSGPIRLGSVAGVDVAILGRHGRSHTLPPSEVPYRANIEALAKIGCEAIVSTTAVGSLRIEIDRGDLVILDQFIDFTRRRINTFQETFEPGNPVHTPMADPFDERLRSILIDQAATLGIKHHSKGTVITIEGPRFSTRAESRMFRGWGADVINMSIATEAALANEAGIPYASVAMSTDYDCWNEEEQSVSWEDILAVFTANAEKVTRLLISCMPKIAEVPSNEK